MDSQFLPALVAIRAGESHALERILSKTPDLATARSSCSHPTLMQCLVLDGVEHAPDLQVAMATSLLERGSPIDEPLIAAASVGNVVLGRFLLDRGAALDGSPTVIHGWTPLEESLYWGFPAMTELLLERGAKPHNLRTSAGLGRVNDTARFFDRFGSLRAEAGDLNSPFGDLEDDGSSDLAQSVLDNALSYAAMGGHCEVAKLLLERGADVNSHPHGFHYRGTALHWAAIRGYKEMCDLLLDSGAEPATEDLTIHSTAAGWARHDGHLALAAHLEKSADSRKGATIGP